VLLISPIGSNLSLPVRAMAAAESSGVLQLIDARGEFHGAELDTFAAAFFPAPYDSADEAEAEAAGEDTPDDYLKTVAILGSRGSGKSTLANRVFATAFEPARPFSGRSTRGAQIAIAPASPSLLVVDTQGSDGRDGDAENVARVATFTLALADALVFNVWAADLGRYEAAGYSLLRTVFLEYSRMFAHDPMKTLIVVVIRDHDDGSSLDSLKNLLLEDIRSIWSGIDAPDDMTLDTAFDFDFVSLPNIRHRAEEFQTAVDDLAARFSDVNHPEYLVDDKYSKHVPSEGFCTYAETVWQEMDNDKDVELPSKKDLVAAYRCDVAYDAQQRPALSQLTRWTTDVDRGRTIAAFGDKATGILNNALEKYDRDTASHAASAVRAKKRTELQSALQARIRALFNKQILLLQNAALARFKEILLSAVADSEPISEVETQASVQRVDEWFARKAESLLVPSMRLSFRAARLEVQNALQTFGEGFRNSPTAQLQAMQQMERQAQRAPPRARNIEFGLGINAACRPAGFGNCQIVSGYARGPHTMQFTLVNDRDAAEQEGQGQVPLFRIQPTITTNIDLA
jgi:Root hair defective 3 GTP-binding protein (RHD3)